MKIRKIWSTFLKLRENTSGTFKKYDSILRKIFVIIFGIAISQIFHNHKHHWSLSSNAAAKPAAHLSYFTFCRYFTSVFCETPTMHFSYFIQISCPRKNKLWNPFDISRECHPRRTMVRNVKCKKICKIQKKSAAKYSVIHFLFFAFR